MSGLLVGVGVLVAAPPVLFMLVSLCTWPERRRNLAAARRRSVDAQIAALEVQFMSGNVAGQSHGRNVA